MLAASDRGSYFEQKYCSRQGRALMRERRPLVRKLKTKAKTNPQNWTCKSHGKSWLVEQLLPANTYKKISWNQFLVSFLKQMWFSWRMFLQDSCLVHVGSCPVRTRIAHRGMCCSRKYPYPSYGRFLNLNPSPLLKFHFNVILLLKKLGFWNPPSPLEFLLTFLGVGMDIFWNYTIYISPIIISLALSLLEVITSWSISARVASLRISFP